MDSFSVQNITPNLNSKNITQSKAELENKNKFGESDIHSNVLNKDQSIEEVKINKADKGQHKIWQIGMDEAKISGGHDIKKFLNSIKKIIGKDSEKILQPIINPSKNSEDIKNISNTISLNKLKKDNIINETKSKITSETNKNTLINDFLKLSENEKKLSEKLIKLGLEIRNNPTLDQINLELTKKSLKTQEIQANRAVNSSKDAANIQKELMDKKIEKFNEQIKKQQEATKKQMKNPVARIFLGIIKAVVGIVVGIVTINPMQIYTGIQSARIDFAMAKYSSSKCNYAEVRKMINKIQQEIPSGLSMAFSIVSAISSAVGSFFMGAASLALNITKIAGGLTNTAMTEIDQYATSKAQIGSKEALLEQERTQGNIRLRYDQLNKVIDNINKYEAQKLASDMSETFSKSSELLKLSSEQKNQLFSSRI